MKLILAIVSRDDANAVLRGLTQNGFQATKLATTGGFLMAGNPTVMSGVDDEKVDDAIKIIKEQSHSRKQPVPAVTDPGYGYYSSVPLEVTVGGAVIFVLDVDRFEKA